MLWPGLRGPDRSEQRKVPVYGAGAYPEGERKQTIISSVVKGFRCRRNRRLEQFPRIKPAGNLITAQVTTGVKMARAGYRLSQGTARTSRANAKEEAQVANTARREYRRGALGRIGP